MLRELPLARISPLGGAGHNSIIWLKLSYSHLHVFFLQTSLLLKPPSCLLSVSQGPTGNILGPFWLVEPSHPHWHPSMSCLVWTTSISGHLFLSAWGTFPVISPPAGMLLLVLRMVVGLGWGF